MVHKTTQEQYDQMRSEAESIAIPDKEKQEMFTEAFGKGKKIGEYSPYCLKCSTMARAIIQPYGFSCRACGNKIGFDGIRLKESPLNSHLWNS